MSKKPSCIPNGVLLPSHYTQANVTNSPATHYIASLASRDRQVSNCVEGPQRATQAELLDETILSRSL